MERTQGLEGFLIFPKLRICDGKKAKGRENQRGFIGGQVIIWKSEGIEVSEDHGRDRDHHGRAVPESETDSVTWRTQRRYGEFPCSTGNAITSATS
jgi:hypothetical protein